MNKQINKVKIDYLRWEKLMSKNLIRIKIYNVKIILYELF